MRIGVFLFGIGDPLAMFSHGDSAVYWPAVLLAHLRCKYRAQQTSDAEDGDQEGPDQRHLPLLQREPISLCRRCVHQLLYKLQAPFVSVWPSDSVCGSGCVCTCACARLCVCVCVCVCTMFSKISYLWGVRMDSMNSYFGTRTRERIYRGPVTSVTEYTLGLAS